MEQKDVKKCEGRVNWVRVIEDNVESVLLKS